MYGQNRAIHQAFIIVIIIIKTVLSFIKLIEALINDIFVIAILNNIINWFFISMKDVF